MHFFLTWKGLYFVKSRKLSLKEPQWCSGNDVVITRHQHARFPFLRPGSDSRLRHSCYLFFLELSLVSPRFLLLLSIFPPRALVYVQYLYPYCLNLRRSHSLFFRLQCRANEPASSVVLTCVDVRVCVSSQTYAVSCSAHLGVNVWLPIPSVMYARVLLPQCKQAHAMLKEVDTTRSSELGTRRSWRTSFHEFVRA